jgi:membrane protein required for colicin V production
MAVIRGWRKGLVISAFSLLGCIIGIAAAVKLSAVVAKHLSGSFGTGARWLPVLSFLLVFIGVVVLVRMIAALLEKMLDLVFMNWLNKLGGIILYLILYIAIYSIFLFYAVNGHLISEEAIQSSKIYPHIAPWGPGIVEFIGKFVPFFKNMFGELESFFQKLSQKAR